MWRCRRFADVRRMHQAGWLVKALPPQRVVQPRVQSEPDREIENDADYGGRNAGERVLRVACCRASIVTTSPLRGY